MNNNSSKEDHLSSKQRPNKSQLKREMSALKNEVEFLCKLSKKQFNWLEGQVKLSHDILDALEELGRIKQANARKRHIQFITKIISDNPEIEQLIQALHQLQNPHILQQQKDQMIENSLMLLLENSQAEIERLLESPQLTDRQQFLQLVRNAQKENTATDIENTIKEKKQIKKLKSVLKTIVS